MLEVEVWTIKNVVIAELPKLGDCLHLFRIRKLTVCCMCGLGSVGRVLCEALNQLRPKAELIIFQGLP